MNAACLHDIPTLPEWRRSGHFLLLALGLHAAVLFYPLHLALGKIEPPTPQTLAVSLAQKIITPAAPQPIARPQVSETPPPKNKTPQAARPILAMPAAPSNDTSSFKVAENPVPPTAPVTPAVPQTTPALAAPQPLSPARFDAAYLHNPEPKYPPLSRRLGEEGKVLLKVRVTADGLPAAVDIEKTSNFERLDDAAKQTVTRWRFVPAKRGEQAIEASVIVPIVFRLDT